MGSSSSTYSNLPLKNDTEVSISKENRLQRYLREKGIVTMSSKEHSEARMSAYKPAR